MLAGDIAGANSLLRIGQEDEKSVGCPNYAGKTWAVWRHGGKGDVPLQELPGNGAAGGRRRRQVVRRQIPGEEPGLAFISHIQRSRKPPCCCHPGPGSRFRLLPELKVKGSTTAPLNKFARTINTGRIHSLISFLVPIPKSF